MAAMPQARGPITKLNENKGKMLLPLNFLKISRIICCIARIASVLLMNSMLIVMKLGTSKR